jgi:type III restriction enzyme
MAKIDQLIINSPYEEPKDHWKYNIDKQSFDRVIGCRPAGYQEECPRINTDEEKEISENPRQSVDKEKSSKKEQAAILRDTVDTVGQIGRRGEQIRNVISVGMLTEGWDARTVTHILGLRAFSSQLLCEQVVGRGLRRRSYDLNEKTGLFDPEYVNIFGIPFTFLPHEGDGSADAPQTAHKTQVSALSDRTEYAITWPNIIRIDRELNPCLHVDFSQIEPLTLDMANTRISAELAPFWKGSRLLIPA